MANEEVEELLQELKSQSWLECREVRIEEAEPGRFALAGELVVPHLEGMERLSYLVSDVAALCQEQEDPALAWARLHAELLPCPPEEEEFPFRVWTDPLPASSFARLAAVIREALLVDEAEDEEEDTGDGFIPLEEL